MNEDKDKKPEVLYDSRNPLPNIFRRFRQGRRGKVEDPQPVLETSKETKEPKKKSQLPFRILKVSHHGPDMPKKQPCPACGAQRKRVAKEPGGAVYNCPKHGRWYVGRK